jgi:hypothetical protein
MLRKFNSLSAWSACIMIMLTLCFVAPAFSQDDFSNLGSYCLPNQLQKSTFKSAVRHISFSFQSYPHLLYPIRGQ